MEPYGTSLMLKRFLHGVKLSCKNVFIRDIRHEKKQQQHQGILEKSKDDTIQQLEQLRIRLLISPVIQETEAIGLSLRSPGQLTKT